MSVTDQLLENNKKYAAGFTARSRFRPPSTWLCSPAWTPGSTCTTSSASRRAMLT